jgi:hypothetical protein
MPSAATKMRGSCLKWRLPVKGNHWWSMLKAAAGVLAGFIEEIGDSKGAMIVPLR